MLSRSFSFGVRSRIRPSLSTSRLSVDAKIAGSTLRCNDRRANSPAPISRKPTNSMAGSRFGFADFDSGFNKDASVMADRVGSSIGRKTATADAHWKVDYRIRIGLLWQQLEAGGRQNLRTFESTHPVVLIVSESADTIFASSVYCLMCGGSHAAWRCSEI